MRIDVLTLFPEMFAGVLGSSILKRAADHIPDPSDPDDPSKVRPPVVEYHLTDIRDYTDNKHNKVDKPPCGGGPGMVIQCQPVWDAVMAVEAQDPRTAVRIMTSPQGEPFNQKTADELATQDRLLIIAGHYEGIDQRVIDKLAPIREISVGDYVLSGGELPAMIMIDAVVRLLPGALGDDTSVHHESFAKGAGGMLDYPHYTKPRTWMDMDVPEVLLSGNHGAIEQWRKEQSLERTKERRPDLIDGDTSDV